MEKGTIRVDILPPAEQHPWCNEGEAKLDILLRLGSSVCCAVGNGHNDVLMLEDAALSICVMGPEGCFAGAFQHVDIVVTDILHALDMLLEPRSAIATLRI